MPQSCEGEEADFKGVHHGVYCALSARNLSLSLLVEDSNFTTPYSKLNVHGSWVRAAFHTLRTSETGQLLHVFFHANDPHKAVITEGCTAPYCRDAAGRRYVLTDSGTPFVWENVKVSLWHKELMVTNGQWRTTATSTVGVPHPRQLRMNVEVKPTYAVDYDPVAPHGLLGQTYDGDALEVNGRRDSYAQLDDGRPTKSRTGVGGFVSTLAKAEGAIEGVLEDYRVASDFATAFRFSRFDAVAAPVRNVSALGGVLGPRHTFAHPGREGGGGRW